MGGLGRARDDEGEIAEREQEAIRGAPFGPGTTPRQNREYHEPTRTIRIPSYGLTSLPVRDWDVRQLQTGFQKLLAFKENLHDGMAGFISYQRQKHMLIMSAQIKETI
jgi:hypothetical protein